LIWRTLASVKAREWYEKAAVQGNASAKIALEGLPIREAEAAGRYAEATKRDGKPGRQTASELNWLLWYALVAKEFTKALTVADRAHALFPNNLAIESARAHALMFMGRGDEAKALYLAHEGERVSDQDNKLWERVIGEDFAELRKADVTHPMMADVEKELGISR
jgi:TPR repeat protein